MTSGPASASVALLYHRIARLEHDPFSNAVSPENFAEQIEVIAALRPLALESAATEIHSGDVPPGGVVVTFDDGYLDNFTAAAPVLERHGVPATVFVTTGATGARRAFWWDELADLVAGAPAEAPVLRVTAGDELLEVSVANPGAAIWTVWAALRARDPAQIDSALAEIRAWAGRPEPQQLGDDRRVMTREELAALSASGLIGIGAHTRTHPVLAARPADEQREEISGSRSDLREWLDAPIDSFAYPFGNPGSEYTRTTAQLVRDAGFRHACSVHPRPLSGRSRPHEIPRHTAPDLDGARFEAWLSERLRPPRAMRRAATAARERMAARRWR